MHLPSAVCPCCQPAAAAAAACLAIPPLQLLNHDYLARILLMVHAHLELARHPRHQAQALAPLQAVLELLEGRVCEAATFRYTVSILLRLLPIRCAWVHGCGGGG